MKLRYSLNGYKETNLSEFTAKKATPPAAPLLPVVPPVSFRHPHRAAIPFRLNSAEEKKSAYQ